MKIKPNNDQELIINSKEKYICVDATAGSGKTFTLLRKSLESLENTNKNVLVISFTRATVREIKDKISNNNYPIDRYDVLTFDSLFLNIFKSFVNLFDKRVSMINITESKPKILNVKSSDYDIDIIKSIINDKEILFTTDAFKKYLINTILDMSNSNEVKSRGIFNLLSSRYQEILIDEYQDMDKFQIDFVNILKHKTTLSITLFGDINQSLYYFRGARPKEIIKFTRENKFKMMSINTSFRCPQDIYDVASNFKINISEQGGLVTSKDIFDKLSSESDNYIFTSINSDDLENGESEWVKKTIKGMDLSQPTCIIASKHDAFNHIKKQKTDTFKEFKESRFPYQINSLIDYETISNIFFNNDKDLLFKSFDIEDSPELMRSYVDIIHDLIMKQKTEESYIEYLKNFLKLIINIPERDVEVEIDSLSITEKFEKYKEWAETKTNSFFTIHGSKGLEYENVIALINEQEIINSILYGDDNQQTLEKIFVTLTRAKSKLHVVWLNR